MRRHVLSHPLRLLPALALLAAAPLLPLSSAQADEVTASAINLPEGPGSIGGVGDVPEISPSQALPGLRYPLVVPAGAGGYAPELALNYAPGSGAGPLGLDWRLGLVEIQRSTREGQPALDEGDGLVLRGTADAGDLLELAPGRFVPEITTGLALGVEATSSGGYELRTASGELLQLGTSPESRVMADGVPVRWLLSATEDANGNRVEYRWSLHEGSDGPLLDAIVWDGGQSRVDLIWESRPDVVVSRAFGPTLELRHRLAQLETSFGGDMVRRYELDYRGDPDVPSSRLGSIACEAADGSAAPTWRLGYGGIAEGEATGWVLADAPAIDPQADGYAWTDVDGDGVSDLLDGASGGQWRYRPGRAGESLGPWIELEGSPSLVLDGQARFLDATGDGRVDLLVDVGDGPKVFVGGGDAPFSTSVPLDLELPVADLNDPRLVVADTNRDGRVDLMFADELSVRTFRADGELGFAAHEEVALPEGLRPDQPGVEVVDLDGDRLPDVARRFDGEGRIQYVPSLGDGRFGEVVELEGVPVMDPGAAWSLRDVNGDGAADLVRLGTDQVSFWINQLDGRLAKVRDLEVEPLHDGERLMLDDVDGDGGLDLLRVRFDGSGPWEVVPLMEGGAGLLRHFDNGLGYRVSYAYRSAAEVAERDRQAGTPWSHGAPIALATLASVKESDRGGWSRTTQVAVRDAWFDPERRELGGFAEVSEERSGDEHVEARLTRRRYDLGMEERARRGQLLVSELSNATGILRREVHELEVRHGQAGERAVRRMATDVWLIEGGDEADAQRLRSEWDHDELGNVLEERLFGRVDPATGVDLPGDERITRFEYATPVEEGPRDRIAEQTVMDGEGNVVRASRTHFDGPAELGLARGEVERGNPTRELVWAGDDHWIAAARRTFDAHGNVIAAVDGEGGRVERRYDDLGRFPIEELQALGPEGAVEELRTTATWDAALGVVTTMTDPAGHEWVMQYDGLGRTIAVVEPGDSPELPTIRYAYHFGPEVSPAIEIRRRRVSGETDEELEVQHLDGLGRTVAAVTHDDEGAGAILVEGTEYGVSGDPVRIVRGQALSEEALVPGEVPALLPAWPAERHELDAMGRPLLVTAADGRRTAQSYGPLFTLQRDEGDLSGAEGARDVPRAIELDGLERTVAIRELVPGAPVSHAYRYDAAGDLVAHVDPEGWETRWVRDPVGRVVEIDSPDAGLIEQRWDRAGRLVERIDGRAALVAWTYDPAGRVLEERTWSPEGDEEASVHYAYDALPGVARFPGQLLQVEDAAGTMVFAYDERGQEIGRSRRFSSVSRGQLELFHGVELDAQGRRVADIYPDGSRVSRTLSARGLEVTVGQLVPHLERDGQGRWTAMALANGSIVRRSHDEVGRMARLEVGGGTTVLDLAYDYDARGRLMAVRDGVGATANSPALDQRFDHDDLGRLIGAGGAYGELAWSYSPSGNLLEQGGEAIGYDPLRPHAAVSLGRQRIGYDGAGQMVSVQGEGSIAAGTWSWDAHGRVERVELDDGGVVEHVYGHDGERAIRRDYSPSGELRDEVLYLDRSVEVRGGELVRWIDVDGDRLVESPVSLPEGGYGGLGLMGLLPVFGLGGARRRRRRRQGVAAAGLLTAIGLAGCGRADDEEGAEGAEVEMDGRTRFHVHDRLGSAALVLDHRGEVSSRVGHRPWGEAWFAWSDAGERGPVDVFTGRERDPGSGVIYIGARHYVPALGRWASPDPLYTHLEPSHALDRPGERNPYRYAANDPVNLVDPDGYDTEEVGVGGSISIGRWHWSGSIAIAADDDGHYGVVTSYSTDGAGRGAGIDVFVGESNADTIQDLQESTDVFTGDASLPGPFGIEIERATGNTEKGNGTIVTARRKLGVGGGGSASSPKTKVRTLGNSGVASGTATFVKWATNPVGSALDWAMGD